MQIDTYVLTRSLDDTFPLPRESPFTAAEARAAGVRPDQLRALVGAGVIDRPLKGVYIAAAVPDNSARRIACLKRIIPPDCVVALRHAGWVHGAEMILAPGEHLAQRPISIFRPSGHGRLKNALATTAERELLPEDVEELDGLLVTTRLRTTWDLGRVRWPDEAIAGMDAMMRIGGFTHDELLLGAATRFSGHRWVRTLRAVAPLVDGRAESPPESILRLRCVEVGLPVTPQVEVYDGDRFIARLDLADEDLAYALEYDGEEWHGSPDQQRHDRDRRAAVRELGCEVWEVTKELLFSRDDVVGRLLREIRDRHRPRRSAA